MALFRALRSLVAILACLFFLAVVAPISLYLVVVPWIALQPHRRHEVGLGWVSLIARFLVALFRFGGATFKIEGAINCKQPGVVIMNHQSVLEVAPIVYIMNGLLPRFVARARYARGIPTVSRAVGYLECIIIDPRRDRAGAVLALHNAARQGLDHCVMLFPEGHRTKDGEIAEFRPAGMTALLEGRQLPVWTIVSDGYWHFRKVKDTFFGLGTVRGHMKVVECVTSPENPEDLPAFIEERRQTMIRELAAMRAEAKN
ncbi:MAG: lysophospholipid acyltransferase family protein [Vicinamibacteria bacterium]